MSDFSVLARAIFAAAVLTVPVAAVPTANNDSFNTPEDVPAGSAPVTLIGANFNPAASTFTLPANWDYLDAMRTAAAGGSNEYPVDEDEADWKAIGFDVGTSTIGPWKNAPMPIQGGGIDGLMGAPNLLTGITGGGADNTVNSYLFRNNFSITPEQAAVAPNWAISLLCDDGCIVYLNGAEIGRVNYPDTIPVEPDALVQGNGGSETAYFTIIFPATDFRAGANVFAIELHQNSTNSSDAGIDFRLAPAATGGFTGVDDPFFGTTRPEFSAQSHSATGGFNSSGALRVQMGNVFAGGGAVSAVSGAWEKTFSLTSAATVTLSFRHRMISAQDYEANEYQEIICDVDGTQFGTAHPPTSTHLAVEYQAGNGNGGGPIDSGWKEATFQIPLAAGDHTLRLGGYGNAGTGGFGGANESFEAFFDDVSMTIPGSISLLANDTGGVPPVTAVKESDPVSGTVTVNADGSFNYVPPLNFFGTDTFTYRAVDTTGQSQPATVTIVVEPVNDVPTGQPDGPYTTMEDAPLNVPVATGVLVNDTDVENQSLTAVIEKNSDDGTVTLESDGSFAFVPAAGFAGTTTFTYRASDGVGPSDPVTVTIDVTDIPDPPTAADDTFTARKNAPLVVTALVPGTTIDDVLPYNSFEWHYFDSLDRAKRNLGTAWRTDTYVEDGDWKIGQGEFGFGDGDEETEIADNPDPDFDENAPDKFETSYFRRTLDILDHANITAVEIQMLFDDGGVLHINGAEALRTTNLQGAPPDLPFDYLVQGQTQDNSTQTWTPLPTVFTEGPNLLAAEIHQNATTSSDLSFDLRVRLTRRIVTGVLGNDADPDPGQKPTLVAQVVDLPDHGVLDLHDDGTFTYTPANDYTGPDSFTYQARDTTGRLSNVATASITVVTGPNLRPTANPDNYDAVEDTPLAIPAASGVLANDSDADGDSFTATIVSGASHGTVTLEANGAFTYQPASNYNGPDAFTYSATDTRPSVAATVTIMVGAVNDLPVAVNDTYAGDPGQTLYITTAQGLLANDTDVDAGEILSVVLETPPAGGNLVLTPDGGFSFSAAAGGDYSFTYRAFDGVGQSAPATVAVSLNAAPATVADSYRTAEDAAFSIIVSQGVLANDSDAEGQPLTTELAANVEHGTLTLNANGSFTYAPAANFNGADSFTYRAFDGTRHSVETTVALTIDAVNDPPVALPDIYGVRVDTPFSVNAANGLLRNDTDVDNANLTAVLDTPPADGVLDLVPSGSFTFTPAPGFSGVRTFAYHATDGTAPSAVVTVTLTVTTALNTILISEIDYNPPGQTGTREEFIEVHNYGNAAVDLTGWRFSRGIDFTFPPGLLIPGEGYLAVPADVAAFAAKFPNATHVTTTGWGNGSRLSNGGETLRLENAEGEMVDEVEYADEGDWAVRKIVNVWVSTNDAGAAPPPVGNLDTEEGLEWITSADPDPELGNMGGSSIQLRSTALPNEFGQNWAAAMPTPGAANTAVVLENSAPLITDVKHVPAVPNPTQQVFVTAKIVDELTTGITASVFYRLPTSQTPDPTPFTEVPMADNGQRGDGAAGDGEFGAVLPAQALNTVVEFYVRAVDAASSSHTWPAPTLDLAGAIQQQNANCLYQVNEEAWTDHRPLYQLVLTPADNTRFNAGLANPESNVAPNCTVIFRRGNDFDVRYLGGIRTRGNSSRGQIPVSLRLDIPGDRPWNDRTAFTLNSKYSYSQFLASRLYEAAGTPVEKAGVVGVRFNGVNRILDGQFSRAFGYYCDLLPRGGDTIDAWFPGNNDGNSYGKIRGELFQNTRWRVSTLPTIGAGGYAVGGYVNEGYTKQTNAAQNDWTDLHAWQQDLDAGTIENFHTIIADTVDIDQWCRFLAVSTIINHGETNMANGDDDDYSVYFGAQDRLARIIPHDLDTCFNLRDIGLGDENAPPTVTIYQCTDPTYIDNATLLEMDKFYQNPVIGRKFKAALRHYLETIFAKANFDATVDQLLDSAWMGSQGTPSGDQIRTHIKTFLDTRRATIENFLPRAFTVATSLPLANGLPTSTSATDSRLGGKIDPARTAWVRVNGVAVTTNPYGSNAPNDNSWSAGTAVILYPGINTLVCEAVDEAGTIFASQTVTISYDVPGTDKSGTLATSETWTAAGGPYNVTANLSVPGGVTLTIEPGTTVFMAPGADLTVGAGGRLLAPGTAAAGITFTRRPSATGDWGGLTVNGPSTERTILSHVTFENNGEVAFHADNGADVELDHLAFLTTTRGYLSFDESSFLVSDCVFPTSTAAFEPVHGSLGIAPGGRGIIRNCWFGKTMGYNDSIDFTGGNRPGPIIQIYNCIFTGSDDDILDLDSTDAWIEGNVFLHAHRNGSPDSASAISGGADDLDYSQVTVIRNLFYDCDNAVTMKQGNPPNGNSAVLLFNTIVHTTRFGGEDTGSGVVNFDDDNVNGEGKGMYLEGNIIWDAENLARNYDPAVSQLTFINNILPAAPPAGATAAGNSTVDPLLNLHLIPDPGTATAEQVIAALTPKSCSPALGSGPLGQNKGAGNLRSGVAVQVPPAMNWPANVVLGTGPGGSFTPMTQPAWDYGYTHYKFSLDGDTESEERPVTTLVSLTGLADGEHTLEVWGKNDAGWWQEAPTVITFNVRAGTPTVAISEVLADSSTGPDMIELYNWAAATAALAGLTLSDDPELPQKFRFAPGTSLFAGQRLVLEATELGFNLSKGGETLRLYAADGSVIDEVEFGPQITDLSIARVGTAWVLAQPTPNAENTGACELGAGATLRLNEWIGANDFVVADDFVELYNPDAKPVSLGDWALSQDHRNEPFQNRFPALSFIAGAGFLELKADGDTGAGNDHLNFRVSRVHDSLALVDPSGQVVDYVSVLPGNPDISQGRSPDGANAFAYFPLPTPGFANTTDVSSEMDVMNGLRITEMRFDPPSNAEAEFIELKNIAAAPLTLTGITFASGITFSFPAMTLGGGAYAVITSDLARFQAQFSGVPATQWTGGRLDNNGESIRLETDAYGLGILDFRYEGDWYPETRAGASLEIIDPTASRSAWDLRESWQPAGHSPGGPSAFGVIAPLDQTIARSSAAILHGYVFPGPLNAADISVEWTKLSGPGDVDFTAPANKDSDATFSAPGFYELRLTARGPGGSPSLSDTVTIAVAESYDSWSVNSLASVSAAQRSPTGDPDGDGNPNVVEFVLGSDPTAKSAGPELVISEGRLALRYTISHLADPNIQVIPQISDNLGNWHDGPGYLDVRELDNGFFVRILVAEDAESLGTGTQKFMRLKVVSGGN